MQTFLPSTNFTQSAKWLDSQRLGKQRVEVLQILNALITNPDYGWQNYPAVKMWRGYEVALFAYGSLCCDEWRRVREYKDTCNAKMIDLMWNNGFKPSVLPQDYVTPPWLTESFASNHRVILLGKALEAYQIAPPDKIERARKVLKWYKSLDWTESPAQRIENKWPYEWPV